MLLVMTYKEDKLPTKCLAFRIVFIIPRTGAVLYLTIVNSPYDI
jgi:hypothetical protein